MAFNVVFHEEAEQEIFDAANFYEEVSHTLTIEFFDELFSVIDTVVASPNRNQEISKGFRKSNLKRFPFKVVYKIENEKIVVVAIAHHKRKPNYWKKRK